MNNPARKTILLVEDEAITALAESVTISSFGYAVISARSGEQAVEITGSEQSIDLVLMDIDLGPGIDGPEAARRILEIKHLPVMFLTGHSEKEYVDRVKKISRYGYVLKNSGDFVLRSSIEMAFELFDANSTISANEFRQTAFLGRISEVVAIYDSQLALTYMSPNSELILGWSADEIRRSTPWSRIHPEDLEPVRDAFAEVLKVSGSTRTVECRYMCRSEVWRMIEITGVNLYSDPLLNGLLLIYRDITEQKRLERSLDERDAMHRSMISNISDVISVIGLDGIIKYKSPNIEELFGWKPSELVDTIVWQNVHPEDLNRVMLEFSSFIGTDHFRKTIECRYRCRDGSFKTVELTAMNLVTDPVIGGILLNYHDVTERKQAEDALRLSESRYRELFENAPIGIFISNSDGRLLSLNTALAQIFGFQSAPEAVEYYSESVTPLYANPGQREIFLCSLRETGRVDDFLFDARTVDGRTIRLRTNARMIDRAPDGSFQIEGFTLDITPSIEESYSLQEYRRRLDLTMSAANVAWWEIDMSTGEVIFDDRKASMLGYPAERFHHYTDFTGLVHPDDFEPMMQAMRNHLNGDSDRYDVEYRILTSTGGYKWFRDIGTIVQRETENSALKVAGIVIDISVQKQSAEKVSGLLAEKEMILKEVHHRIKNNMNTMASLLSLQAGAVSDPVAIEILQDAQGRLRSMSVLYDKLFLAENLIDMSVKEYLPTLVDEIVGIFPARTQVHVEVSADDFPLPVKVLTSLGIIINELLTNVIKHAFVGRSEGHIKVSATKSDTRVTITVQDDGVGLPEAFAVEQSPGFGLVLVRALTSQIDGTIRFVQDNGTKSILQFDLHE
ncbi:MAG TPA: PAS domain S-box protein [Spirochaetia bacterium]|nr:PAS domain S-box protein [Spirochaetia bacterium]